MSCFGGGGSTQESVSESKTAAQKSAIDMALGNVPSGFEGYASYLGKGVNVYPDTRVAELTPTQSDIFSQLPGVAATFGNLMTSDLQGPLDTAARGLLSGEYGAQPITPEQEAAYFKNTIENPRMKTFTETELPGVKEAFAGPGYWSGARATETAKAYRDVGDWLGTQKAQTSWDTALRNQQIKEDQANRILNSINPSLAVSAMPLQQATGALGGLSQTLGLGGIEQQQVQNEINAKMQKFFEENQITDPEIMAIFTSLIGTPVNYATSEGSSQVAGLGYAAASGLAGGIGTGYGYALGGG